MRLAGAVGVGALMSIAGCAVGIPRVRGEPVAPPAPNHVWRAPPGVLVDDSLRRDALPQPLTARASSLTLRDIVDLALSNSPATRESWAQARWRRISSRWSGRAGAPREVVVESGGN
jgi:hypothetical protein